MRRFDVYRAAAIADPRFYEPLGNAPFDDDLAGAAREFGGPAVTVDGIWARCRPVGLAPLPAHGWKIHISTTPARAAEALAAVRRVFLREPFHFKCLRATKLVGYATSRWWHAGQVGKVIAIYAYDAKHARHLLAELHAETAGLPGPYVLSDKRYRDSSCLYYRYGQFRSSGASGEAGGPDTTTSTVQPDGTIEHLLNGPDGHQWRDERLPVYRRPPWVAPLFDGEDDPGDAGAGLHGYRVLKCLHFGGAGGTYLAERESDGTKVVLKEARPHTAHADDGSDGQERLRREYAALQLLAGSGVAPLPIEMFTEWEHLFLVEEYLADTVALIHLVGKFNPLPRNDWRPGAVDAYREIIDRVADGVRAAVAACHARGLVYGDLSLTNVLVCPETFRVWLIDFESTRALDGPQDRLPRTPGFAPPPDSAARRDGRAFDAFGVAAVELALVMPRNTLRSLDAAALARSTRHAAGLLGRDVHGLLTRLDLPVDGPEPDPATVPAEAMRFVEAVMTPDRADRLFPADPAVFRTNPWSVAHGAAGVLRALHGITGRFPDGVRDWMTRTSLDRMPAGLYHGLAGVGWTLCDAGEPAWGAEIVRRAVTAARSRPLPADVLTGSAGVGMACLAVWVRTGDAAFLDEAARIGDDLATCARDDGHGLHWTAAGTGAPRVGYGHGSAGVALFLLYLHLATGKAGYLRLGRRALAHDLGQAVSQDDGVLAFPAVAGRRVFYPYWQRGAAGVGTALARYCRVVDDPSLRDTLDRIVAHDIGGVSISTGLFTGMCGPANLALDYADLFDAPHHREVAARLGQAVTAMASVQPEGVAFAGDSLLRFSTDFATGSAGTALLLHRIATMSGDFNYTLDMLLPGRVAGRSAELAAAGVGDHA